MLISYACWVVDPGLFEIVKTTVLCKYKYRNTHIISYSIRLDRTCIYSTVDYKDINSISHYPSTMSKRKQP